MFKSLLVAIDGGEQSRKVLELASRLAESATQPAHLHLICVVDPAYALTDCETTFARQEYPAAAGEQHHAESLIAYALEHLREHGIDCSAGTLRGGNPALAICEEAARLGCDLIVIGHRHLSFLGRLLEPSVGSRVLDDAPCPVLVEVR